MANLSDLLGLISSNRGTGKGAFEYRADTSLLYDVLNMVQSYKANEDVADEKTLTQLVGNLQSSTNEVQLDNFKTLLDNTSVSKGNQMALDSMYNIYTNKRAGHDAGETVYADYDKNPEKYKLTYEQLDEMDFGFDEFGNKVNPKIGQSQIDLILDDANDVAIKIAHLENAATYKYGSTPNSVILDNLKKYQGQLSQVQKAWFGGLNPEEIDVILSGGDYTTVQDAKLRSIDQSYNASKREETKWLGQQMRFLENLQNNDAAEMNAFFEIAKQMQGVSESDKYFQENLPSEGVKVDEETGQIIVSGPLLKVQTTLGQLVQQAAKNQTELIKERKRWQKFGTEDPT